MMMMLMLMVVFESVVSEAVVQNAVGTLCISGPPASFLIIVVWKLFDFAGNFHLKAEE